MSGKEVLDVFSEMGFDDVSTIQSLRDPVELKSFGFTELDESGISEAYRALKKKYPSL